MRSRESDKISVISGRNRELYFSIKEIVLQTRRQLGNLADARQLAWFEYISATEVHRNQDRSNHLENSNANIGDKFSQLKVYPIRKKLNEIIIIKSS